MNEEDPEREEEEQKEEEEEEEVEEVFQTPGPSHWQVNDSRQGRHQGIHDKMGMQRISLLFNKVGRGIEDRDDKVGRGIEDRDAPPRRRNHASRLVFKFSKALRLGGKLEHESLVCM